jgi:hypothetical protein
MEEQTARDEGIPDGFKFIFHPDVRKELPMYTNVCKHCFKVFKSKFRTLTCPDCRQLDQDHFDDIESYLREYPNSNAIQISEALGITAYEVLKYLNEGRLNISKGHFEQMED